MSYKATGWAYDLPISGPRKGVLVVLADMADEAFSCYPGQQKIVHMSGFSEKTVRRALASLEEDGLISREQRHGRNGYRTSDRYILHVGLGLPVTEPAGQSDHRSESPSLPVTLSLPTGQSDRAEESPVEPLEEPPVVNGQAGPLIELSNLDTWTEFWSIYPRHVKKARAETAYRAAIKAGVSAETILEGARKYATSVAGKAPEFIAHPSSWLNDRRWDDEYPTTPSATGYDRAKEFTPDDYS
ncbi:hypothetical protein BWO91_06200 [Plantibacter flavus]|uniref:helix-turn-helix domain-containing protein n=1 Tax=Plantibacter flavus TaxID=150123 RepID=UPI00099DB0A4|nr:helix-turn-helix domain-containing protein [Plantibacter flavus]AQX79632.1 hypothetical protein BWO91_06200 [Plantibacter flavus]